MWYINLVCFFSTKTMRIVKIHFGYLVGKYNHQYRITPWLLCQDRPPAARHCACLLFYLAANLINLAHFPVYNLVYLVNILSFLVLVSTSLWKAADILLKIKLIFRILYIMYILDPQNVGQWTPRIQIVFSCLGNIPRS